MTEQLTAPAPQPISAAVMEKVITQGDLKALSPREKVAYYGRVCESLGLNPLTRPFDYLSLNGRLVLYARREATDQLRKIHGVTLHIKAREVTEGCYVVTAAATMPDGRQDESIGAVPIDGLKGEGRANAMMKCETKAKRRATLSICGLSFLDESEVGSISDASPVAIDPQTGEAPAAGNDPQIQQKPWSTFKEMIVRFSELRGRLPKGLDHVYYETLKPFGVEHSNQFKDSAQALECYRQLAKRVEASAWEADEFDQRNPEAVE